MKRSVFLATVLALSFHSSAESLIVEKQYTGFTVYIDCRNNGPIAYEMALVSNQGDILRLSNFVLDPSVPTECQMTTGDTFQVTPTEEADLGRFQRGHLADANSLDSVQRSETGSELICRKMFISIGCLTISALRIEFKRSVTGEQVLAGVDQA